MPITLNEFEKGFNDFLNNTTTPTKEFGKPKSSLRIIEVDMKKGMKHKKEFIVKPDKINTQEKVQKTFSQTNNDSKDVDNNEEKNTNQILSMDKSQNHHKKIIIEDLSNETIFKNEYIIGKNSSFPLTDHLKLSSKQFNKDISLKTYFYPAYYDRFKEILDIDDIVQKNYGDNQNTNNNFKGAIIFYHGMYEHSKHLAYIAKILSHKGYDIHAYDYRGHGMSGGLPGLIESKELIINDSINFLTSVCNSYLDNKNIPIYTLGYSLGGLMCSLLSQIKNNPKVILSEDSKTSLERINAIINLAGGMSENSISPKNRKILKFVRMFLSRFLTLKTLKVEVNHVKNKLVADYLKNDNLNYRGRHYVATALAIEDLLIENNKSKELINTPMFFIQGNQDKALNPNDNKTFFESISKNKGLEKSYYLELNDADHSLPYDYRIEEIINKAEDWLNDLKFSNSKF